MKSTATRSSGGFESTLEQSGKLLKRRLRAYMASNAALDRLTWKDLFREAHRHGLLTEDAARRWFACRDNRNTTAHDYGVAFAEETLKPLPAFLDDAWRLAETPEHE